MVGSLYPVTVRSADWRREAGGTQETAGGRGAGPRPRRRRRRL